MFHPCVISLEIPGFELTYNGAQFVSKVLETLCTFFGVKQFTNTAFHMHTNRQVKRYNKAIVARLHHSVADHQHDWDLLVQLLLYT